MLYSGWGKKSTLICWHSRIWFNNSKPYIKYIYIKANLLATTTTKIFFFFFSSVRLQNSLFYCNTLEAITMPFQQDESPYIARKKIHKTYTGRRNKPILTVSSKKPS